MAENESGKKERKRKKFPFVPFDEKTRQEILEIPVRIGTGRRKKPGECPI